MSLACPAITTTCLFSCVLTQRSHWHRGGLYLDVNRPLRLDWSHRQRVEIPWYCTSPTEAVPKNWNTSRCLVVPKNVRLPAIINQRRGPNLPCPQFKPIPESESLAWALDAASEIPGEELNFHTTAPWDIKHITRKIWISLHPSQTHNSAPLRPPPSICSPFWGAGRNERQQHRWVCTLSKQERQAAACRPLAKNAEASVMRILFFLSACKAPAIILILSSPQGSYYSIYNNSPGLLHFVHTGQRKKKRLKQLEERQQREEMCSVMAQRPHWWERCFMSS